MSDELIEAVKSGDSNRVESLLSGGADPNEPGIEQGWPALCFAAGQGNTAVVSILLAHGADPLGTGKDCRTPYRIALAAGHLGTAKVLAAAEPKLTPVAGAAGSYQRPYCKAYPTAALAEFLPAGCGPVVFVHGDLSVTKSISHGKDVLIDGSDGAWRRYCLEKLEFRIPSDFELAGDQSGR